MQAVFLCIGPKGDPRETHLAGFCSIGLAQINSRKSAFLRTALAFGGYLVPAVRRGEGELGNNKGDNGSLTRNTASHGFKPPGAFMIPKIILTVAIVLGVAVTAASAATKHRRPAQANPPVYNAATSRGVPSGVSLSTACKPTDSPCRTQPDSW
jgi:hypothetical protein